MSRITLQSLESAPAQSKPYLENARRASGFIPNLLLALSNSPQALETYITVGGINNNNSLSAAERETVQLIAATVHGCGFCVAGHSATVEKKNIMAQADLQALRERQTLPDSHLEAIASFTREVIATRGAVSDAAWRAFREAGYSERQALDVILGVSLATLCNFANSLAQTPLNTELSQWAWSD
ncbi:putative peroxidase-related enzyme [Raoultella sp. BIGb0138]|uniref:carboxymuconolactone decarboxylase family protein n=1 Tax=Raoultella sp. BIGb0138 TaxID=2485115 RepID=UPI00104909FB|nr:carboxymuconolactone decarboxylase family protein [Raoultella sp. BIGb0138]TCW17649.1 putative peroxidase-related enzyme [Raoultella sp. BIGb0138]